MDLGPTILNLFGVPVPEHMDGKALTVAADGFQPAAGTRGRLQTCPDAARMAQPAPTKRGAA